MADDILNKLLKEADIIKKASIENVKDRLTEAFAPQIKSILTPKLREAEGEEEPEETAGEEGLGDENEVDPTVLLPDEGEAGFEGEGLGGEGEGLGGEGEGEDDLDLGSLEDDEDLDEGLSEEVVDASYTEDEQPDPIDDDPTLNKLDSNETSNHKGMMENAVKVIRALRTENVRLRKGVNKLYSNLKETSLTNAKLTYIFALLNENALKREQKIRVLKRIDEARTIREAKLIYSSLKESFALASKNAKTSNVKNLTESISLVNKTNSNKTGKSLITENILKTWATLAGVNESEVNNITK
jgi:hypothetical protein